jgi:septum site-determining protein MinD
MTISSIVTIAGAKGGVGKTTTSINLATALAGKNRSVAVVELDLAMANIVDFLSLPRDESDPTIHDVLAGRADPLAAAYSMSENISVIPSGTSLDGYVDADLDRLPEVLQTYAEAFEVVVLDTGAGLNRAVVEPMRLADGTVIVSTPRVASVRDAEKTATLSERVDTPVYGLVLTQSGTGQSPGPERISEFLDVDLLGHVPSDEAVPASQDNGVPVVEAAPDSPAGSTYGTIAENLLLELSIFSAPGEDDTPAPVDNVADEETLIERAVDETSAPQAGAATPAVRKAETTETDESSDTATKAVVDGGSYSTDAGTRPMNDDYPSPSEPTVDEQPPASDEDEEVDDSDSQPTQTGDHETATDGVTADNDAESADESEQRRHEEPTPSTAERTDTAATDTENDDAEPTDEQSGLVARLRNFF